MTAPDDEPQWDLLPESPAEFFGLPETFDLKDLKRSYNRLIKRFKPEKFPDEFQKIRAAYESIETHLRFLSQADRIEPSILRMNLQDVLTSEPARPFGELTSGEENREIDPLLTGNVPPDFQSEPALPLLERVRQTPPESLRAELRAKSRLSQEERMLLVFLDDASDASNDVEFLSGLLASWKTQHDHESWNLLYEYLQSQDAKLRCRECLEHIFTTLPDDDAYILTAPLWKELQRQVPFAEFRQVLESCLSRVRDHRQISRLNFDLQILKQTMFYADFEWTDEEMDRLTKGDVIWPNWLDIHLWTLERLINYRFIRKRFLNGNPLRVQLDDALRAYCAGDDDFDQRFLNLQAAIVADFPAVAKTIRFKDQAVVKFWEAWQIVCDQVSPEYEMDSSTTQEQSLEALGYLPAKLSRLTRPLLGSPRRWNLWAQILFPTLCVVLTGILIFVVTYVTSPPVPEIPSLPVMCVLTVIGILMATVFHIALANNDLDVQSSLTWEMYDMGVRRALVDFLRQHPLPATVLYGHLRGIKIPEGRLKILLAQIERDLALRFYATAAWSLR